MSEITDEILKFVEEGIFESGKAYSTIIAFENYLEESIRVFLNDYNWKTSDKLTPKLNELQIITSKRKTIGAWFNYNLPVVINGKNKRITLGYESSVNQKIRIYGRWNKESNIRYTDINQKLKIKVQPYGIELEIILEDDEKKSFKFFEYYTIIMDELIKHADQLK